ncbi:MAG TPA: carboxypeptidase regulatory-like domain-containing protein [Candidatus Sulfotelmatobacter sp.]|nr:carboxypeptidase regulatory-like domain-containing protein [Candidatus Sulfotelmatobacter sp.]
MSTRVTTPLDAARFSLIVAAIVALLCGSMLAQSTVGTGSIVGTVTDPSGAVVSNAKITITNLGTAAAQSLTSNSAGAFNSGPLAPGTYKVQISGKGFNTVTQTVTVEVGNIASANAKMTLGQESTTIEVQASELQVNTEQATVQGVLTSTQIDNLPVNGRNFLDLAQLEPGVQIQDGQNFDPTKAGYSSISFGGRFGRTARIEVDGVDVSDETVGTTTTDIPASGIQEFQIGQASLDMSTELTSSGAVNVTTKSGTNAFHGQAFGQFRDASVGAANLPGGVNLPYQRSQYGASLGGPVIKDKLFFFGDGERTKQDTAAPVPVSAPFQQYSGSFSDPFREDNLLGKVDYQLGKSARLFYRYSYFKNLLGASFGYGYSVYDNKDITRNHVVGVDFNTGPFTHSIRFSYLKFQNQIADATSNDSALPFYNIGAAVIMGSTGLAMGPNLLAPQSTPQSNHQFKYDGSRVLGSHIVRFGVTFNHVQGGGFASFFKNGPLIYSSVSDTAAQINSFWDPACPTPGPTGPCFPGGVSNPLNYTADGGFTIANGLGYSTTKAAFGFPGGGLGPDNRILLYLGDSWKIKPNLTVMYGLRYERDTGRTDSQYAALPNLNSLLPGLGNAVTQPNKNFAPEVGFAWDPMRNGKTVIRGGIGIFWENAIWNNVLFDGPYREPTGAFLQYLSPCASAGSPSTIQTGNGPITASSAVCGSGGSYPIIGLALPAVIAFQQQYQADSPPNLQAANPAYADQYLSDCTGGTNCYFPPGSSMFNPNYRSPRSIVMNIGVQREIRSGMIVSVDYIRNVQTHFLLGVDQNHAGDISNFNLAGAQAAISATNNSFGCGTGIDEGSIGCAIGAGATMADYGNNGLGSSSDMGGNSCLAALGYNCAFPGKNPLAPPLGFLSPVGRSLYNGLQMKWTENVKHPFRGVPTVNFQVSYSLSRFENSGGGVNPDNNVTASSGDQDFIVPALDNANVNRYFGPSTLDRTHQLSFGGYFDLLGGFQLGIMSHFYSPLSTTLTVPNTGNGAGEIFRTDFTGSGVTQDPIPGTKVGNFDRGINASNINNVITNYNNTVAGNPTPAGNVLIANGLMTQSDLVALGGVAPTLSLAPAGQVNYGWLKAFDTTFSWSHTFFEKFTIKPGIAFFNLPNFANFDLPTSMMSGLLSGSPGAVNGTTRTEHEVNRVGVGTGVYTLGSPRQTEFSLKIIF